MANNNRRWNCRHNQHNSCILLETAIETMHTHCNGMCLFDFCCDIIVLVDKQSSIDHVLTRFRFQSMHISTTREHMFPLPNPWAPVPAPAPSHNKNWINNNQSNRLKFNLRAKVLSSIWQTAIYWYVFYRVVCHLQCFVDRMETRARTPRDWLKSANWWKHAIESHHRRLRDSLIASI